jgi:hypothetical protein
LRMRAVCLGRPPSCIHQAACSIAGLEKNCTQGPKVKSEKCNVKKNA